MKKVIYFLLAIVLLQTTACKKETNGNTTTVTTVPVTPSGLTAQLSSVTKVNLTWTDNSTNEDGFKIERKTSNTNYVQIGSTATNISSFIDTTLQLNTKYTYRIYAYNTVGNSPTYSNEVTVNTIGLPVIDTSNSFNIYNITGSSAKYNANIISNGNSPITAYGVVWSKNHNPTIVLSTKTNNGFNNGAYFSFLDELTNLDANTTYYAKVYATNDAGTSYGNEVIFKTTNNIFVVGEDGVFAGYWVDYKKKSLNKGYLNSIYAIGNDVYAVGYYDISGSASAPPFNNTLIKNGVPSLLPSTGIISSFSNSVFASGSDIYVAGIDNGYATIWKNGIITHLSSINSNALSIYVSFGNVYVSGSEDNYATIWKNGIKTQLSNNTGSSANSVYVSGNDVYVAGVENGYATIWKNGVKTQLSNNTSSSANSVYVSGNDVYVAGNDYLPPANGAFGYNVAAVWKNGIGCGYVVSGISAICLDKSSANSICVAGNDVYVAGSIDNFAAIWKNGVKTQLSNNTGSEAKSVYISD